MLLKRFLSAFPVLALAVLIAAFAARPALAQEIDDESADISLFARVLGAAGILAIPGPGIDYKERPALVVPPTMSNAQPVAVRPQQQVNAAPDPWNFNSPAQNLNPVPAPVPDQTTSIVLPPPVDPNAVRQKNPDFPVDPEIRAAQKAKINKKKGPRLISDDPFYGGRLLKRDEMRVNGPRGPAGRVDGQDKDGPNRMPSREQDVPIFNSLWSKKNNGDQPQTFTGEPERQSLTQPPSGYLTPSANAPYGVVGKDKAEQDAPTVHPNMPNAPMPQTR